MTPDEIKQAHKEGKKIEWRPKNKPQFRWQDKCNKSNSWDFDALEYRVRNRYPSHMPTEEEEAVIKKSTRKHLLCKRKSDWSLYEVNPKEMNDWRAHERDFYDYNVAENLWEDRNG